MGLGALAAVGGGAAFAMTRKQEDPDAAISVLEVPEAAVTKTQGLTLVEDTKSLMSLVGDFDLPFGSLVWANDDRLAACLLPTENSTPLTQVALLALDTGLCTIVLPESVGAAEGFQIYDVRATGSGLVWTEADILDNVWRVYTATTDGASIGTPALVDEGDTVDWESPSLAAVGDYAFWQVLPRADGAMRTEDSLLKRARMGTAQAEVVYESHGRMSTPPYSAEDAVIITPRADTGGINYQLTRVDAATGAVTDTLVLPNSMRPLEAAYGPTGFTFSFDAWYTYGDGISGIGTYVPRALPAREDYEGADWVCFDRTPTAAPAWCGSYFIVKSTSAVCGVNLTSGDYFAFNVESGSDTYGDYLASSGTHANVVTFSNVDDTPLEGDPIHCCRVRVWAPVA